MSDSLLAIRTALGSLALATTRGGHSYYASPAGSDANPGTLASPFLTVARGLSVLAPGDTLYLRGGTFNENVQNGQLPTGQPGRPVTVAGYPGETAVLMPSGGSGLGSLGIDIEGDYHDLVLRDFTLDGVRSQAWTSSRRDGVKLSHSGSAPYPGAHHVSLLNLKIKNFRGNGVLLTQVAGQTTTAVHDVLVDGCEISYNGYPLDNASGNAGAGHGVYCEANALTVRGCDVHHNGEYGVHVFSSEAGATTTNSGNGVVVTRNRIHDNGNGLHSDLSAANGWGLIFAIGTGARADNNLVYRNKGGGLQVTWSGTTGARSDGARLLYNSVYNSNAAGNHGIEADSHSTNCVARNNAAFGNSGADIFLAASGGASEDYNVYGFRSSSATNTPKGAHSLSSTSPLWNAPWDGDLTIITSSPCAAAGSGVADAPLDFTGATRTLHSVGAYDATVTHAAVSWYADPVGGSDANAGTLAAPFLTLNSAVTYLLPADTLFLRGGTFREQLRDKIPTGVSGAPVTVQGYQAEVAVLQPTGLMTRAIQFSAVPVRYVTLKNFFVDGSRMPSGLSHGVEVTSNGAGTVSNNLTLDGLEVSGCPAIGVRLNRGNVGDGGPTTGHLLQNCKVHDNGRDATVSGHGVYAESTASTFLLNEVYGNGAHGIFLAGQESGVDASANLVTRNRARDNGVAHSQSGYGVVVQTGSGNRVTDNLVYGNYGGGVSTSNGASGTRILGNSVYNNNAAGGNAGIEVLATAPGAVVKGNASHGNNGRDQSVSVSSPGSVETNNVYGTRFGIAQGAGSVVGDPDWVDAAAGDFRLNAGSPCHDAGVALADLAVDFAGVARGSPPDAGAYED